MSTLSKCACAGVASLALVAWLGAPGAARAEINYNTIALTGATGTSLGLGPNLGDGVNFSSFGAPALNAAGEVAFLGFLTGTAVDDSNSSGIWSNAGGTLTAVARSGSGGPGPNVEDDVYFSNFSVPFLKASGEVAFVGVLTGTGVDGTNDRGIWSNAGGTLAVVARKGSGGPGPNVEDDVYFSGFGLLVMNAAGEVAFRATLTGTGVNDSNNGGIWTSAGGTLAVVAREGSGGPGPDVGDGVNFLNFSDPVLNAAGKVAFRGFLTGTGVDGTNDIGIWTNAGGTLAAVARTGSDGLGPDVGDGVNFLAFGNPVMNANGEVAFVGLLTGTGVDVTNDIGIWTNAGGTLVNIVRTGSLFDVDPTAGVDLRMISSIGFESASGGEDGRRLSFNDAGLLTFALTFTDGSSGIFTAQVSALPEPTAGAVMALAGLALLRRRK
jgi:hypothetical protein